MDDRIFHKWLKNNIETCIALQFFRHIYLERNGVIKVIIFDIDINLNMLDFFPDGNQALSMIQTQPIEPGQIPRQRSDLLCTVVHGNPVNQIQRIVEKMWVDLRLQCPYLCHFNFLTKLIMLLHQPLDFLHHTVKIVINFLNFIFLGCDWQICVQISAFQTRHFRIQLFQSSNVVTGKKI